MVTLAAIGGGCAAVVSLSAGSFTLLQRLGESLGQRPRPLPARVAARRPYPYR